MIKDIIMLSVSVRVKNVQSKAENANQIAKNN